VPAVARTGAITVTTTNGAVTTTNAFLVTQASDLVLSLAASAPVVAPGDPVDYLLGVTNAGPSAVSAVVVSNQLPVGVEFVTATASQGTFTVSGGKVVFEVGNVARSGQVTLGIQVRAPAGGEGYLVNSAGVRSLENDLNPANNAALVSSVLVGDTSRTLQARLTSGGANIVLSWPVSSIPFQLQSVPALGGTGVWELVSPPPVAVEGLNRVTNPVSGSARFYRLMLP
jgi:uncharacterized repeat protein (TIGR01451 family)